MHRELDGEPLLVLYGQSEAEGGRPDGLGSEVDIVASSGIEMVDASGGRYATYSYEGLKSLVVQSPVCRTFAS